MSTSMVWGFTLDKSFLGKFREHFNERFDLIFHQITFTPQLFELPLKSNNLFARNRELFFRLISSLPRRLYEFNSARDTDFKLFKFIHILSLPLSFDCCVLS